MLYYNQFKGTENSEGRREYRKGKQEDNVIPGNRIREIEKFKSN